MSLSSSHGVPTCITYFQLNNKVICHFSEFVYHSKLFGVELELFHDFLNFCNICQVYELMDFIMQEYQIVVFVISAKMPRLLVMYVHITDYQGLSENKALSILSRI